MSRVRWAALTLAAALLSGPFAQAGSWQNNAPFGATLQGDLYSPSTPGSNPAVLVVIHYCTGNKSVVHSWFESYAEKNGFYLIAPDAGKQCFDSSASRDGDKAAIVKMVDYVVAQKGADKSRVFAAGLSSGGCMTNTLLAVYPDVFAGGAAMPGFPAGGWPAGDTTCTKCGSNPPSTDGKYWADIAKKAFAWSGTYPCSEQWVGGADEYNFDGWLPAVAAQFQTLSNLSTGTAGSGAPSGWQRTVYKDAAGNVRLETNVLSGQKHDLSSSNLWGSVVTFLGLDKPTGACGLASTGAGGAGGGSGTGGTTGAGGSTGGTTGAGGRDAGSDARDSGRDGPGGDVSATGGASAGGAGGSAVGGTSGSGGSSATGGNPGSGGSSATGGKSGSGGSSASGGSQSGGAGGSVATSGGAGGNPGSGGSSQRGGSSGSGGANAGGATTGGDSGGGCACATGGANHGGGLALLFVAVLGLAWLRRRSR